MVVGIWTWTCIIWMAHQCLLALADIPEVQKFSFQEDIEVGQRISVVCSVKLDTGLVSFRWLKNGKELEMLKNVRIKNDQEFSVLIIDPSSLEDEGNYTCVASNNFGSGKYTAHLSVKAPPTWIFKPVDIITTIGESTTINCIASGSPTPRIVWRKYSDTNPTEFSASFLDSETYHKSNNSILSISSVSYTDAGFYECVANNGIAPNIKANFSITIRDVPKIKKFHFDENIKEGDVTSVTCFAVSQNKPIKFGWKKNGKEIMEDNIRVKEDNEFTVLIFDYVKVNDGGNYTCSVSNPDGSDSYSAYLDVKAPPKWEILPIDILTTSGESIIIKCQAFGSPKPQISFRKVTGTMQTNTVPEISKFDTLNGLMNGTWKLSSVSSEDAGHYECVADNGIFPAIKSNFTILIRGIYIYFSGIWLCLIMIKYSNFSVHFQTNINRMRRGNHSLIFRLT